MKLNGTRDLAGSPAEWFDRLLDPAVLMACIAGCQQLTRSGPDRYTTVVKSGIGPISGLFEGEVRLLDLDPPRSYRLELAGRSPVGHLAATARVVLAPIAAGTGLDWEAEVKLSGLIATLGARLAAPTAKKLAEEFFDRLAAHAATGATARKPGSR